LKRSILIFLILILWSCNKDDSAATALVFREKSTSQTNLVASDSERLNVVPANLPIPPEFRTLDVQNLNLDNDVDEEQIILVSGKDNLSSPLIIYIADYDVIRKTFFKSWESPVLARANEPYSLFIEDLIGDHSRIIALSGMDDKGYQTINLFKLDEKAGNSGLTFSTILELSTPGNLEIQRPLRSQAYDLGQKNEESYTIVTETNDPKSSNLLDIIRTTYGWRFQDNRYIMTKTEKLAKDSKTDVALTELYKSDDEKLINFLTGPWYYISPGNPDDVKYISFDPQEKIFNFFSAKSLEQFFWKKSTRTTRNSFLIQGTNNLVLEDLIISISIISLDTLNLEIRGNSTWNSGLYGKIAPSIQKNLMNGRDISNYQRKGPSGFYRNEHGLEINFDPPFFTKVENGVKTTGSASIYELGGMILQLKTLDENGRSQKVENYLFTKSEENRDLRTVRTLKLFPGKLSIEGFEPYNQDFIKLEQIEVLSSSE